MPKLAEIANRPTVYIGVDPGASGGIVELYPDLTAAFPMPVTERDICGLLSGAATGCANAFAVIEKVSGYIGEGQPGSAMFKFGMSYGGLRMALIAAGIPFEEVTPQAWQKALGIGKRDKAESRTQWKNRLKAKAQQLFPQVKVTLATADALLIALYCKRKHTGTL